MFFLDVCSMCLKQKFAYFVIRVKVYVCLPPPKDFSLGFLHLCAVAENISNFYDRFLNCMKWNQITFVPTFTPNVSNHLQSVRFRFLHLSRGFPAAKTVNKYLPFSLLWAPTDFWMTCHLSDDVRRSNTLCELNWGATNIPTTSAGRITNNKSDHF